jgi:hypothetical protein
MRRVDLAVIRVGGQTSVSTYVVAIRIFLPNNASEQRMLYWNLVVIMTEKLKSDSEEKCVWRD